MTYKGITLLTTEELQYEPLSVLKDKGDYEMLPGLYFSPRNNLQNLAEAICLGEKGAFDFAIPQAQWEKYGDHKGLDRAIWFYPHKGKVGHLFGTPLTIREMMEEFKKVLLIAVTKFFIEEYPW